MPEWPIRTLPAACQQKGREGYRRCTRSTMPPARALHTALTKYAALARPLRRSRRGRLSRRRRREYSAASVRIPPSSRITRSPYIGLNEATRGTPRKTRYIRVLPPPGWQRRAMRKHSDPPLSRSARQLESPVYNRGAFLSSCQSRSLRLRPEHAVFRWRQPIMRTEPSCRTTNGPRCSVACA